MQKLKDTEKDLKYVIRYIKVGISGDLNVSEKESPSKKRSSPQHSTDAVVDESERIFSKLIQTIEKHRAEVKELLRFQEKAVIGHSEEALEKIQREMAELRRTNGELERLCHTEDHVHFLQVGPSGTRTPQNRLLISMFNLNIFSEESLKNLS